jgi:hypothetical protein
MGGITILAFIAQNLAMGGGAVASGTATPMRTLTGAGL